MLSRPPVSKTGQSVSICVAADAQAAEAGAQMLRQGGNAFDAAAAAGFVETVISPHNTGLGGYGASGIGFSARTKTCFAIDANSVAPAAARADMFPIRPTRDPNQYKFLGDSHRKGPLSVGVPGVAAGLAHLAEKFGKLGLKSVMAPALAIARAGVPMTPGRAMTWLTLKAESEGRPAPERSKIPRIVPMDDLVRTMEAIERDGASVFYEGEIGRAIADDIKRRGGILSREDMARYKAETVPIVERTIRGHLMVVPPPASGGLTSVQIVALLDMLGGSVPPGSIEFHARLIEAAKVAWEDRLTTLGDFRSMPRPPSDYLGDQHLEKLLAKVRAGLAKPSKGRVVAPDPLRGTVHLAAADSEGNVMAWTQTHGGGYGSMVMAKGTGIVLGHGMCRFEPRSDWPNSIAPGRRPLHNMCPLLILRDGIAVGALGAAGGRTIVNNVAALASARVLHGMKAPDAAALPRTQIETMEPVTIEKSAGATVLEGLRARGHELKEATRDAGIAHLILREGDRWEAAAEPRSAESGVAAI